jgi:hypothetical protein
LKYLIGGFGMVAPNNDRTIIEAVVRGSRMVVAANSSRHFLPTPTCQGSPSAAQYIEGQPRDQRGYPYDEAAESKWRAAYQIVQRHFREEELPSPGLIDFVIDLMQ